LSTTPSRHGTRSLHGNVQWHAHGARAQTTQDIAQTARPVVSCISDCSCQDRIERARDTTTPPCHPVARGTQTAPTTQQAPSRTQFVASYIRHSVHTGPPPCNRMRQNSNATSPRAGSTPASHQRPPSRQQPPQRRPQRSTRTPGQSTPHPHPPSSAPRARSSRAG